MKEAVLLKVQCVNLKKKKKEKKKEFYKDFQFAITAEDTWMALNRYLVEQSQRRLLRMTTRHWQFCETQPVFM